MTWSSINCAFARLSQIVGLNRLVDVTKRMGVQSPLQPFASFATGANEITPMDMAAGAQTIANQGLHHDPYYVERVEGPGGSLVYQHTDPGTQVLTPEAANTTVSILKGVLQRGTARRIGFLSDGQRPAAGKTGTQDDNTNAWFVGFTPQLTTAVWVGDPKGYTPMTSATVPAFKPALAKLGKSTVQGATFPLSIWAAFMEPALVLQPIVDWPAPPKPPRRAGPALLAGRRLPRLERSAGADEDHRDGDDVATRPQRRDHDAGPAQGRPGDHPPGRRRRPARPAAECAARRHRGVRLCQGASRAEHHRPAAPASPGSGRQTSDAPGTTAATETPTSGG